MSTLMLLVLVLLVLVLYIINSERPLLVQPLVITFHVLCAADELELVPISTAR
jgi:hypothetical protein